MFGTGQVPAEHQQTFPDERSFRLVRPPSWCCCPPTCLSVVFAPSRLRQNHQITEACPDLGRHSAGISGRHLGFYFTDERQQLELQPVAEIMTSSSGRHRRADSKWQHPGAREEEEGAKEEDVPLGRARSSVWGAPAGAEVLMEKFFTPVRRHRQDPQSDSGRPGPRARHGPHQRGLDRPGDRSPRHAGHPPRPAGGAAHASSSSGSSTSSSSSWSSEASLDDDGEAFLAPRHARSCVDIPRREFGGGSGDGRGGEEDEEEEGRRPLGPYVKLRRGQSRSEERLLPPPPDDPRPPPPPPRDARLYKTASLEHSLAGRDSAKVLLGPSRPGRATSALLPGKGILKHRVGPGRLTQAPIRKAKSMEVISSASRSPEWAGGRSQSGKGEEEEEEEEKKEEEEACRRVVQEKLKFSAFLNEITRQVLSPSRLSSLGVPGGPLAPRRVGRSPSPDRRSAGSRGRHPAKPRHPRHACAARPGSSPRHTDASTSPENSPASPGRHGPGYRHDTGQPQGSGTSPELSPRSPGHHTRGSSRPERSWAPQHGRARQPPSQHAQQGHQRSRRDAPSEAPGHGSRESQSSKSDSSRNRDNTSTASPSPERCERHGGTEPGGPWTCAAAYKEGTSEADRVHFLQEQNEELHHSLVKTTVRMEVMGSELKSSHQQLETELQRTREELERLRENFRRLQDSYTSSLQTNVALEQKLHSVVPTLLQGVLEKHFQRDWAADQSLLPVPAVTPPPAQFMDDIQSENGRGAGDQSLSRMRPVLEEEGESDWSEKEEGGRGRGLGGQHGVRAFVPWRQVEERGRERGGSREGEGGDSEETGSESGLEEVGRLPHTLQVPHVQFVVPTPDAGLQTRFQKFPPLPLRAGAPASPIRILSRSLEEIRPAGPWNPAPSPPHHLADDSDEDVARPRKRGGAQIQGEKAPGAGSVSYQPPQGILDHFFQQLRPDRAGEAGETSGGAGWAAGASRETTPRGGAVNGERGPQRGPPERSL
ncbi:filaggrin isoform X2 [Lepisosteus oculatus]|uniref:filaggrin isoform X2 n=1 Tax=Lepisosteus oculatus TaxID=7918 RepID=UPI0035F52C30